MIQSYQTNVTSMLHDWLTFLSKKHPQLDRTSTKLYSFSMRLGKYWNFSLLSLLLVACIFVGTPANASLFLSGPVLDLYTEKQGTPLKRPFRLALHISHLEASSMPKSVKFEIKYILQHAVNKSRTELIPKPTTQVMVNKRRFVAKVAKKNILTDSCVFKIPVEVFENGLYSITVNASYIDPSTGSIKLSKTIDIIAYRDKIWTSSGGNFLSVIVNMAMLELGYAKTEDEIGYMFPLDANLSPSRFKKFQQKATILEKTLLPK